MDIVATLLQTKLPCMLWLQIAGYMVQTLECE